MPVGPNLERGRDDTPATVARHAPLRADRRLSAAITDLFLPDDARLDERTRLAVWRTLDTIVGRIETDIRRHSARTLAGRGADARAEALLGGHHDVVRRLERAGLLRDRRLMDELIARSRGDLIAGALPSDPAALEGASLLVMLAEGDDSVVAAAAKALMAADNLRRAADDGAAIEGSGLPADLHHQLVWWVAASIREAAVAATGDDPRMDRAIVDAAQRNLAAHDEGERPEAQAIRLAIAIDARPEELGDLLVAALADRRLTLFIALLSRAVDFDYDAARAIVLEPEGDRLWLALRGAGLERTGMARIAVALADADRRRDIDRFAEELNAIVATPVAMARSALAPLTLHHDLRLAIDALAREDRR